MVKQHRKRITSTVGELADKILFDLLETADPTDQPAFYKHLATIGALYIVRGEVNTLDKEAVDPGEETKAMIDLKGGLD